jgi:Tripartite ATP-independent periplasmic transporter, DctM component/AMP-binding enzyme C-terminal domain
MGPISLTALGFLGLFGLIALRVPIGVAMAIAGFVGFGSLNGFAPAISLLATQPTQVFMDANLAVIPLFLFMGSLASAGGLSDDIYRLMYALIGHFPGGLACATIGGCAGFGAVCGSSPATAATMGQIALPQMLERGYSPGLAAGTIAAGGTLGMLIPPSIVMVIYAFLAQDEQRFLTILDRKKDIIISGGENIYPREVEETLYAHDDVAEAAVIGVPDDRWGEAVKAFVVLHPGAASDEAALIEHCRRRIASYKKPKSIEFIAELPRLPNKKIDKKTLRAPFWSGRGRNVN